MPVTRRSVAARLSCRQGSVWRITVLAAVLLCTPASAQAQMSIFDALARRFSGVSFFVNSGGVAPSSPQVRADRLTSFGIEVLVNIGEITRPTGPVVRGDSAVLSWTGMQVVRRADGVDTINTYAVRPGVSRQPTEAVWSLELGLGYGQTAGFESRDPSLDLKGAVRDLPSAALYASYVPTATYFGLRSGLMRLQALQVYDDTGRSWGGEAESFMAGAAVGQVVDLLNLSFFAELGYSWRPFPSIRWTGPGPVPPGIPREMSLHGWSVGVGVQFALAGN
jgi:hypothetical protein